MALAIALLAMTIKCAKEDDGIHIVLCICFIVRVALNFLHHSHGIQIVYAYTQSLPILPHVQYAKLSFAVVTCIFT